MVYVFGLDLPLVELLLVFLVLLTAGLAFILVELKKLHQLLQEERGVVQQFEGDLARFEKADGKVHNNQLEGYIRTALGRGMPRDKVEHMLIQRGWSKATVDKMLSSIV